jgi:hypothetical protein
MNGFAPFCFSCSLSSNVHYTTPVLPAKRKEEREREIEAKRIKTIDQSQEQPVARLRLRLKSFEYKSLKEKVSNVVSSNPTRDSADSRVL